MARVGIFGGSFDPIHLGHLWIAEAAREQLQLDQVRFIPAAISPLKPDNRPAGPKERQEMVQLAIAGNPAFILDDRELRRSGISYTVETLRELHREFPTHEWFLIVGGDSLQDFDRWREIGEICQLAIPAVAVRAGIAAPDWSILKKYLSGARYEQAMESRIQTAQIELSSRDLRNRIREGKSVRYRLPASVEAYIAHTGLYREVPKAP